MKLMTKEIERRLAKYPLYSQEGKGKDAMVVAKYFLPVGAWTWYVLEGEKQSDGDWMFFGIVVNNYGEREYGYFTLSQLESVKVMNGLIKVERDIYFDPSPVAEFEFA